VRISVALATFQGARFLHLQLESIANQTLLPTELVVGDDGSSDRSAQIVAEFAQSAPFPVSLQVHSHRVGSARNFESVIGECAGDVIALSDQDDVWKPTKLEELARAIGDASSPGMVFSDGEVIDADGRPLGISCWDAIDVTARERKAMAAGEQFETLVRRQRRVGGTLPGAMLAFRTHFRPLLLPFPDFLPAAGKGLLHDSWIALLVSAVSRVGVVDEPLVLYRQHGDQQIGVQPRRATGRPRVIRGPWTSEHARWLRALHERLRARHDRFGGDDAIALLERWQRHLDVRSHLPRNRFRRVPTVARELTTGRYRAYSSGLRSAARDLLS
jgi:glycosyltransferase involved in cell wall biosynthesis